MADDGASRPAIAQNNKNAPKVHLQPDALSELAGFLWKGISFPVSNVSVQLSQDLAIHKYPNLDAARVENTGRNPLIINATGLFYNTILPSPNEKWEAGTLYPDVFSKVFNACADGSTGKLRIPYLGYDSNNTKANIITAKCVSCHAKMEGSKRSGQELEMQWIETIDDDHLLTNIQSVDSAISNASFAATNLDVSYGIAQTTHKRTQREINNGLPLLPSFKNSFSVLMGNIRGIFNTTALIGRNGLYQLEVMKSQVNSVIASINQFNDVKLSSVKNDALVLKSYIPRITNQVLVNNSKTVLVFTTNNHTTLPDLANLLKNDIRDLMNLNPTQLGKAIIKSNTQIRYYRP